MRAQLKAAVVQVTATTDVAANLKTAGQLVQSAAQAGADFIALPENYGFLGSDTERLRHAQGVDDSPLLDPLREIAQRHQVVILAGSIPERGPDQRHTFNTSVLIGKDGQTLASYRKIHLFDVQLDGGGSFVESSSVTAGDAPVIAEIDGWSIGLSVCYDLRFPELYRALSGSGARILAVPSAFTLHTGKDHWDVLLRARAIENLCYVVAPGQFGHHFGSRHSWGKSMIIDPWGTALATAPERQGFVLATLDAQAQDAYRRQLPSLSHRRL